MRHADDGFLDDFDWFDGWCEAHFYLLEQKNYAGLVECCEQRLKRDPDDPHAVEALAEAHILNGQPQRTLALVTPYYEHEPDHPLYQLPNCFITPHIGSATANTRRVMAGIAIKNLIAGIQGKPLPYCVNPEVYNRFKMGPSS